MLKKLIRNYFNNESINLEASKQKVWQKVSLHIQESAIKEEKSTTGWLLRKEFGLVPLIASLILVIVGAGTVSAFDKSLPGDTFYSLKVAVEEAQLKIAFDDQSKDKINLSIIEKRSRELAQVRNDKNTEQKKEIIEKVQEDVGRKAVALANNDKDFEPETETIEKTNKEETEITEKQAKNNLVQIAQYKEIGEAVTEFLQSTTLTGKEKTAAIVEIVKEKQRQISEVDEPTEPLNEDIENDITTESETEEIDSKPLIEENTETEELTEEPLESSEKE